MRRSVFLVLSLIIPALLFSDFAHPCGIKFSFRPYLDKRFWQPFAKYEKLLAGPEEKHSKKPKVKVVFAGTGESGSPALQELRDAYQGDDFPGARILVQTAMNEPLSSKEREEVLLIDAKVDMREGEENNPSMLEHSADKLVSFLSLARTPELRSEARGWLARVYYLMGNYSSAAKIYLDEFTMEDTIFSRESLMMSLRMIFRYNGSIRRLADQLEDFFDTPRHALFAVTIATNPIYFDRDEMVVMSNTARKAIAVLQKRRDLFSRGKESEALALALMRAALYMGDTGSVLEYAKRIPPKSATATLPDYNWMKGASHFLRKDFAAAEAPLLKMYYSPEADDRDRNAAAQGLTGVYQKLGRGADQLHAAFLATRRSGIDEMETSEASLYWPAGVAGYDLAYLLDIQLSNEELEEYLLKYEKAAKSLVLDRYSYKGRRRTAYEVTKYALAVRLARQEKYVQAGDIYEEIKARPRAKRMRELANLYAKSSDTGLPSDQRLEGNYSYASYLAEHSTQVFFNDMLWNGLQTWTFLGRGLQSPSYDILSFPLEGDAQGLTGNERGLFLKKERQLKDDQEERWRAYKILVSVAKDADNCGLRRKALQKALKALRLINTGRFGREEEIRNADIRLSKALVLGYLPSDMKNQTQ
jgi:hypothetical protein